MIHGSYRYILILTLDLKHIKLKH